MIGFAHIPFITLLPMWFILIILCVDNNLSNKFSSSLYHLLQSSLCSVNIIGNNCHNSSRLISESFLLIFLRSEEHTSELQSRQYLVCRLLLEKKKKKIRPTTTQSRLVDTHTNISSIYYRNSYSRFTRWLDTTRAHICTYDTRS